MRRNETQSADTRFGVRIGFTTLLLALLALLAACGSVSSKAKATVTPVPPTATPLPKGWNAVASPPIGSEGNLAAVAALSATNAWAVGNYEGPDSLQRTLVEHWNGTSWTQVPSPSSSQRFNILSAVATVSANDAWAVGSGVTASNKNEQLIEHWDGKTWTITPNPAVSQGDSTLSGVAAISASDVWAVEGPLIEHWDGVAWKVVSNPGASSNGFLNAITAVTSKDVWAVGRSNDGLLTEHWDGASWKVVPVVTPPGDFDGFTGVSATAANDVWAVGSGVRNGGGGCAGASGALIEHWDGARWSSVPFASPPGATYGPSLTTVTAVATNDAWVVGGFETSRTRTHAFIAPVIEHWDGAHWSNVTSPTISTNAGFTGVAVVHGGPAWVVGQAELSNGAGPTVVEQWSGSQWVAVASPSPGTLSNGFEQRHGDLASRCLGGR